MQAEGSSMSMSMSMMNGVQAGLGCGSAAWLCVVTVQCSRPDPEDSSAGRH